MPDPEGAWIEDPAEPRILIEAERQKGQPGRWKLVPEGLDSDGDEEVGEDPRLDAVVNENFPHAWVEHAPRSGVFPTDEPEVRALFEFVLEHRDLALGLTCGRQGSLGAKPDVAKGGGRQNDAGDYDMNRAWPSMWRADHVQFGAGSYRLDAPLAQRDAGHVAIAQALEREVDARACLEPSELRGRAIAQAALELDPREPVARAVHDEWQC